MIEIYVSPSGSDSTGDGSAGNPYREIQRAIGDIPGGTGAAAYRINAAGGSYGAVSSTDKSWRLEHWGIPTDPDIVINSAGVGVQFASTSGTGNELALAGYIDAGLTFYQKIQIVAPVAVQLDSAGTQACSITGVKTNGSAYKANNYSIVSAVGNSFVNTEFHRGAGYDGAADTLAFKLVQRCDFTGASNIVLFGTQIAYHDRNTFDDCTLTVNNAPGSGYEAVYGSLASLCADNSMGTIQARFIESTIIDWADIELINYAACTYLDEFQDKADADLGVGSAMHSDSWLFAARAEVYDRAGAKIWQAPRTVIDKRPRIWRHGLALDVDSTRLTLTDGLASLADNRVAGANDLTQGTAANRPQFGYDKTGKYAAKAADLTLTGVLVDSWANSATATVRTLPALTGSGATRPSWNSGTNAVDFAAGKVMSRVMSAYTYSVLCFEFYGSIPTTFNNQPILIRNGSGNYGFWLFLATGGANDWRISATAGNGTVRQNATKIYTAAQFTALTASDIHIVGVFINSNIYLFVNGELVASILNSTVTAILTINETTNAINNASASGTISAKKINTYFSALTANDIGSLYANRNDYDYELTKYAIVGTGTSLMQANLLADQTLNKFSCGVWLYRQSSRNVDGVGPFLGSDSFAVSTDKGFSLNVTVSSLLWSFKAAFGNGTTGWSVATSALSQSAFNALYLNTWVCIFATFANGVSKLYINGVLAATASGAAGSIIMPVSGLVSLMGSAGVGNMLAGNKLEAVRMYDEALSAYEVKQNYLADLLQYNHLRESV